MIGSIRKLLLFNKCINNFHLMIFFIHFILKLRSKCLSFFFLFLKMLLYSVIELFSSFLIHIIFLKFNSFFRLSSLHILSRQNLRCMIEPNGPMNIFHEFTLHFQDFILVNFCYVITHFVHLFQTVFLFVIFYKLFIFTQRSIIVIYAIRNFVFNLSKKVYNNKLILAEFL